MKKFAKFINVILILAILGVLTLEGRLLLTQAQDAPAGDAAAADEEGEAPPTPEKDAGGECSAQIDNYMIVRKIEFGQFMNDHFQANKPTSELIPGAIEKYREYRADVLNKIATFVPKGGKLADVANAERESCKKAAKDDFQFMSDLIRQHIIENAYAKKSTRLLDKYKVINDKLEKLNFTIAQTYGYFAALAQKLPCYAKKCTGR